MSCLHLNAFCICKLYIWSPVRVSSLWAVSLWSDSFAFITASLLHLHGFNPLPLWAVIQSVKQQLFVVKEATAEIPSSFSTSAIQFDVLMIIPHFHTEYWRGVQHPCHETNFQVLPCCDEFPCCESDGSQKQALAGFLNSFCTSRLWGAEPEEQNYCLLLFCLIAFGRNHTVMLWTPQEGWRRSFWLWLKLGLLPSVFFLMLISHVRQRK